MEFKLEKFVKFFCADCGRWLGVKEANSSMKGIFPYCPACKKQVIATEIQVKKYHSAKCQHY